MSTDQTAEQPSGPRPTRLTAAAALAALEGAALAAGGLYVIGQGVFADGDSPGQSALAGLTLIVLALIPLIAARGLLLRRSWSRGPAIVTQIIALPVAWTLLSAQGALIPAGAVLAVVALAALVLLVNPTTAKALGIRGARGA
ncbi:hypothetical protein ACIPW9_07570 [Streptomyces sp. NPDC090052]|uniref:hypothetical protein n=1 Tax=unclassified Streptomyces TaxID=2593676 RepID=UPI002B1E7F61|nr:MULTISPECIES: hypothetical protein [unclassified Streptomyces]